MIFDGGAQAPPSPPQQHYHPQSIFVPGEQFINSTTAVMNTHT